MASPSASPSPAPHPQSSLHSLRSTCLSLLLAQQSHPIGFPILTSPPKPILSPFCDLQPSEQTLLALWDELRDVIYERLKAEARAELLARTLLEEGESMDEEDDDDGVLDERIQKLEQEVATLQAEQRVKEEISLGIITGREVQNTIYGMRETGAPASSIAKTRALRSLTHLHTTYLSILTHLHNTLTTLHTHLTHLTTQRLTQTNTNRLLTTHLLKLTSQTACKAHKDNILDEDLRGKVEEMELQVKDAKMRWEVARNVFQGVVAGSGVDWVRVEDGRLRTLILEAGEELE
ncbi:centromere protein H (CENP-H)-domain-containing protein [Terfezia claveryi]|nr:centromere protein H (CENP-H)-domain-containing protein [Terfezia claveryi]